jgi:hypothetical protein
MEGTREVDKTNWEIRMFRRRELDSFVSCGNCLVDVGHLACSPRESMMTEAADEIVLGWDCW